MKHRVIALFLIFQISCATFVGIGTISKQKTYYKGPLLGYAVDLSLAGLAASSPANLSSATQYALAATGLVGIYFIILGIVYLGLKALGAVNPDLIPVVGASLK